jgi:hypothetical protein
LGLRANVITARRELARSDDGNEEREVGMTTLRSRGFVKRVLQVLVLAGLVSVSAGAGQVDENERYCDTQWCSYSIAMCLYEGGFHNGCGWNKDTKTCDDKGCDLP